jgi:predicted ATPase/DNA-binding CsgD family transcriptional regulator
MMDNDPFRTQRDVGLAVVTELSAAGFADAEEIGRGGFGIVYRCRQVALERTVAVKVLTAELDENRERFLREQRAMGRLTGHPNIVGVLQVGETQSGYAYLVMQYHRRGSLEARIRRLGPLGVDEVLRLGVKMAGALEAAHRLGIVHRDVKPANILLTDYGELALSDFGIAHISDGFKTATGTFTGSPAFTAPEILRGDPPSESSDVYGLGATLFCGLTGHAAFERRSGEQIVAQFLRIADESAPDLRESSIPDDVSAVVERAMCREPHDRQSAGALGEQIQQLQACRGFPVDEMALRAEADRPEPHAAGAAAARRTLGNLPAEVTSFVGRSRELADAKRALSKSRLVTLTGVGGVGKTRVAERVARDRRRAYPHGVWLVDLGELPDPALLAQTVLTGLGVRAQPSGDALGVLIDSLSSRQLLLVLDNCEHLLDEVAGLSAALLRSCPDLQILATSREPLRVVGEAVLPVPPMAAPEPGRSGGVAGLSRYDAVALFTERAAAAVPDFGLTEDNYRAVAALCYRLDGLPLAIELAAGRLRSLSPGQILSRLDDRYALLMGGERGRPGRQQTLRASIEWSYQLCTPAEQRLWARLCVFAGSFELDAVEAVCTDDMAGAEMVDLVSGLVDKSIVVRQERGAVVRYRLLESIREFGLERLTDAGEGPALRMAHWQWYGALIHTAKAEWISARQVYWLARLTAESANIRSAVDFCLNEHGDPDAVMEIVVGLPLGYWWAHGKLGEGRHWLDEALGRSGDVTVLRVRALLRNAVLATVGGEVATGDQLLDEARGLIPQVSDPMVLAQLHHAAARAAHYAGDLPRAVSEVEQALAMPASRTDLDFYLDILILLAFYAAMAGQHERSKACYQEIIQLATPRGESLHRSNALMALGLDAWRRGDPVHAVELHRSALEIKLGLDDQLGTALGLEALAWGVGALGQHKRAAQLLGTAEVSWDSTGASIATLVPELIGDHHKSVAAARAALGEQGYAAALQRGRQMPLSQVLDDAEHTRRSTRSGQADADGAGSLTSREKEIAGLLAQGLSNKAIAQSLVIAQRTAETHVANVLVKLGLTSRSQVAAWVAEQRGIDPPA